MIPNACGASATVPRITNMEQITERWVGCSCFLDGERAKIIGRTNKCAKIVSLVSAKSMPFSWIAVDRIMKHRRTFESFKVKPL